jgi:hypothetical protein
LSFSLKGEVKPERDDIRVKNDALQQIQSQGPKSAMLEWPLAKAW